MGEIRKEPMRLGDVVKNDAYGDLEYIILEVLTDEQLEEEYGDYMREHHHGPLSKDDLPTALDNEYRTREEAQYLSEKYLKDFQKAPMRTSTPSGKVLDHCAECDKYGVIASNLSGRDLCKVCDVKNKATDAGIDAMRGD